MEATAAAEHLAITITTENFEAEVTNFKGVVLVDFWATWCGPCRIMSPRVEEIAAKFKGNDMVKIGEVDVDAEQALSQQFQVLSIPTFKTFVGGVADDQRIGVVPVSELEKMVQNGLDKLAK